MPRGVYKRKKTKAQRAAIARKAAETRAANRAAQQDTLKETRLASAIRAQRKAKRFLSDAEKGRLVGYFFSNPGRSYQSWGAVADDVQADIGIAISGKQAERLREAFSLPFEVVGATDTDAVCQQRLARMEAMLAHIQQRVDSWTE